MLNLRSSGWAVLCVSGAFFLLYGKLFVDLSRVWTTDANYSHGWLILPLVGYFAWQRRDRLHATPVESSALGLPVIAFSLGLLLVGTAGVEFFLMRVSAIGVVTGVVLFLAGPKWLRILAFPLALSLLMIPLPPMVFYKITFPLQLMASKFGVAILRVAGVPVLREGNVIALPQTTLEVTEACSGIRSLLSLFTLALIYAQWAVKGNSMRGLIAVSSIPIAVVANGLRVAGTGLAAEYVGGSAATGLLHSFSGWTVFMTSLLMLVAVGNLMMRLRPASAATGRSGTYL